MTGSPFVDGILCTLAVLPVLLWLAWAVVTALALSGVIRGGWG